MSQAGSLGSGGGGGGGTVDSLTPDVGGAVNPTAGTIPTLGYQAGTVQTMRTYNDGSGNFRIADQTWQTQYVVDPSTTPGLKGTFQTIQAAINQAVSDGASLTSEKMIFIRYGTYSENLSIPPGIFLKGEGLYYYPSATLYQTLVFGHHTTTGANICRFENVNFRNDDASADLFTNSGSTVYNCYRCIFDAGASTGKIFTLNLSNAQFYFCLFVPTLGSSVGIAVTASTTASFTHCDFQETPITAGSDSSDCFLNFQDCLNIGSVALDTTNTVISAYNSTFFHNRPVITGTGRGTLFYCYFLNDAGTGNPIQASGTFTVVGCSDGNSSGLYNSSPTIQPQSAVSGNVIPRRTVSSDTNIDLTYYYVGVNTTGGAVTLTMESYYKDRIWIFKDEGGDATTNTITINPGMGVTIDGASSAVINTNYGSLTLLCNGTNFFII